jgi:hypothetical protein
MTTRLRWPRLRQIAATPLVHFFIAGSLIMVVYQAARNPAEPKPLIQISQGAQAQLVSRFQGRAGRLPTSREREQLIQNFADNEVLFQEALRLRLERQDVVVRRRLIEKMTLLLGEPPGAQPSDAELDAFMRKQIERYRPPIRFSFKQIYFSHRLPDASVRAQQSLERLRRGQPWEREGEAFLHGNVYLQRTSDELAQLFGEPFAGLLPRATLGAWSGPYASSYGVHLIHLSEKLVPASASLSDRQTRHRLLADYARSRNEQARTAALISMRRRYRLKIETTPPTDPSPSSERRGKQTVSSR